NAGDSGADANRGLTHFLSSLRRGELPDTLRTDRRDSPPALETKAAPLCGERLQLRWLVHHLDGDALRPGRRGWEPIQVASHAGAVDHTSETVGTKVATQVGGL